MYVAPYFVIAFAVNFGLLAFLGWASNESLWSEDARLLGCAAYAASVAAIFSLTGLQRVKQSITASLTTPVKNAIALAAETQARELAHEPARGPGEPVVMPQSVYPPAKAPARRPVKGELVT
jgi:hypothetical protein